MLICSPQFVQNYSFQNFGRSATQAVATGGSFYQFRDSYFLFFVFHDLYNFFVQISKVNSGLKKKKKKNDVF